MAEDARFEDGGEAPLNLAAVDSADLDVISTLLQDAVSQTSEIAWMRTKRRLAIAVNRFRWEESGPNRELERVQSVLVIDSVLKVRSSGIDPRDKDVVLVLLGISFAPGSDGSGAITLTFSGDGEMVLEVECIDAALKDVSRPYIARSQKVPHHPVD